MDIVFDSIEQGKVTSPLIISHIDNTQKLGDELYEVRQNLSTEKDEKKRRILKKRKESLIERLHEESIRCANNFNSYF